MRKKIYLPGYAIEQLETSDDSSIWAKPMPFSKRPSKEFSLLLEFDPDSESFEGIDPTEEGYFYPDRTEPETILELLTEVDLTKLLREENKRAIELKKKAVFSSPDAIYRCFLGVADAECWARYHKGKIDVFSQHIYTFSGFGHVPLFTRKHEECLERVLTEGAGLCLNRKEVRLCDESYNRFSQKDSRFAYDNNDLISIDGKTYKLFQDHDDGARGWAIFTVKPKKYIKIINEDHCDNVSDWMMENNMGFLKNLDFKINFKYLNRHNHKFHETTYEPTPRDFEEDFHIDEKGKRKKA